ncbi:hypothetical protein ACA910_006352 [Epithemia clementina (nom. ined.)]
MTQSRISAIAVLQLIMSPFIGHAFVVIPTPPCSDYLLHHQQRQRNSVHKTTAASKRSSRLYNIFDDIGDMIGMSSSTLVAQSSLPYDKPFCQVLSCSDNVRTFAVQERLVSFTGEDFDVCEAFSGAPFVRVRGAMLHLPGKDKMRMYDASDNRLLLELDRKLIAATPTYDIFRYSEDGGGMEKIGWIEKKLIAMTDTFDVYMEGKGGFGITGLFKPPPAYRIAGDFLDRNFVMRTGEDNQVVARVSEDWIVEFDAFNHYQVQVAPGMDALLVLACLCAIDEEFDEEHKKKKQEG